MGASAEASGEPRNDLRLDAKVVSTVFHGKDTRYTVLRVQMPGEPGLATWVGRSGGVDDGAQVSAAGEWVHHPTHGRQFAFTRLVAKAPTTLPGIVRRLERYPGLGVDKAEKIVAKFGLDTLTILDKQPRRLLEVEGVGPKTLEKLLAFHEARNGPVVEVENQLIELDLPTYLAQAIVDRYQDRALQVMRERPYRLAREVRGIGFLTADKIARALGVDLESDDRVDAGLLYTLEQAEQDGHCALPEPVLVQQAVRILELPADKIADGVARLVAGDDLVRDERPGQSGALCYPRRHYEAELQVAAALVDLALGTGDRPRAGDRSRCRRT